MTTTDATITDPLTAASWSPMDPLSFKPNDRAVWLDDAQRILAEEIALAAQAEAHAWNRDLTELGRQHDKLTETAFDLSGDLMELADLLGMTDEPLAAKVLDVANRLEAAAKQGKTTAATS